MVRITGTSYNDNGTFQIEPTPTPPPRITFFPILEGTEENDRIFGLGGNDIALGNGGDDEIFGGPGDDERLSGGDGNDTIDGGRDDDLIEGDPGGDQLLGGRGSDTIDGGSGSDVLIGAGLDPIPGESIASPPGINEIDVLTGGTGTDLFALGSVDSVYYDDGNNLFFTDSGTNDYAQITDFNSSLDFILLKGNVTYETREATVGSVEGIGIYVDGGTFSFPFLGGTFELSLPDELIGFIPGDVSVAAVESRFIFLA